MDFANVRSWEVEGGVRDIYGIAMGMGLMGGREGREGGCLLDSDIRGFG